MEVVINRGSGVFGLSNKAVKRYYELKGQEIWFYKKASYGFPNGYNEYTKTDCNDNSWRTRAYSKDFGEKTREDIGKYSLYLEGTVERTDLVLIQVVKELGQEANDEYSRLKIVEIPDGVDWEIVDYNGDEWVAEKHRIWC